MRFFYATSSGGSGGPGGNIPGDAEQASEDYYYDNGDNGEGEDKRGFFSKYKWWILILGGIFIISKFHDDDSPIEYPCSPTVAYRHAKEAISLRLKSPHSAVFPSVGILDMNDAGDIRAEGGQIKVMRIGNTDEECKWRVVGYVDAQNSFGAMVRQKYLLDIEYREDGVYTSNVTIH